MTNLYLMLNGTYQERKQKLSEMPREFLEAVILDSEYNHFLSSRADYVDGEDDKHDSGKRVPYIGWYWRHIEFSGDVPIGDCGDFIGFMANNKWDHPERNLTEEEKAEVLRIIDEAMVLSRKGGALREIMANTYAKLDELWDYMQTLTI